MADRVGSQQMNLTAVRRHDPYVADIVDSATQVAVYEYSSETSEWVSFGQASMAWYRAGYVVGEEREGDQRVGESRLRYTAGV